MTEQRPAGPRQWPRVGKPRLGGDDRSRSGGGVSADPRADARSNRVLDSEACGLAAASLCETIKTCHGPSHGSSGLVWPEHHLPKGCRLHQSFGRGCEAETGGPHEGSLRKAAALRLAGVHAAVDEEGSQVVAKRPGGSIDGELGERVVTVPVFVQRRYKVKELSQQV